MLLIVFALHTALRQQKRVVLFRKGKDEHNFSLLYIAPVIHQYWRRRSADIVDVAAFVRDQSVCLCLDGLLFKHIDRHFQHLGSFKLLATSAQYPLKDDDIRLLRLCMVPFWSLSNLTRIGEHKKWRPQEIKTGTSIRVETRATFSLARVTRRS